LTATEFRPNVAKFSRDGLPANVISANTGIQTGHREPADTWLAKNPTTLRTTVTATRVASTTTQEFMDLLLLAAHVHAA
jgi:hypothetical protein